MKYKVHDVDKALLARPEIRQMLLSDFREALRGGAQGMESDMFANHGRPWGFPLNEIKTKILFWFCELDHSVPPAMGRYLSRAVPNCNVTFIPDAGHLWILVHLDDVLNAVALGRQDATRQ